MSFDARIFGVYGNLSLSLRPVAYTHIIIYYNIILRTSAYNAISRKRHARVQSCLACNRKPREKKNDDPARILQYILQ